MNRILTALSEMNIHEPKQIRDIALLMLDAANDRHIHEQALEVASMTNLQLELATQQIIGGR